VRRGRTDEQQYAIISPYFDGRIKMNGPFPEITNISFLAKLFFKTFVSLKHLSDYQTVGLSDCRTIGLSTINLTMDRLLLKIFFQVFSLVQLMTSPFKASNNGAKIGLNNGHFSKKCIRFSSSVLQRGQFGYML
jgi:hypothetical protein